MNEYECMIDTKEGSDQVTSYNQPTNQPTNSLNGHGGHGGRGWDGVVGVGRNGLS